MGLLGAGALYLWPNERWIGWTVFSGGVIAGLIWAYLEVRPIIRDELVARRFLACIFLGICTITMIGLGWSKRISTIKVPVPAENMPPTQPTEESKKEPPKIENAPIKKKPLIDALGKGTNLTMETGQNPEPNYALENRFSLTNHNPLGITQAGFRCETQKIDLSDKMPGLNVQLNPQPHVAIGPIGDVAPGDSFSIYCDFSADPWANELKRPELNIWVSYKYSGKDMKRGFKFLAIPTQDGKGNFIWLPRGAADEIKP